MPETIGYERNNKIRKNPGKELKQRWEGAQVRLQYGMDYRQKKRETAWREAYRQYMNDIGWDRRDDTTADMVAVNISFSTVNTLVPFVADENPRFIVEPYSGDATVEWAELLESFINRLWESDEIMGQVHLRSATFDHLIYGDGYVKVGYEIEKRPTFDVLGDPIEGRELEVAKFIVERISPWNMWIDPYADGIHNARWVCQRIMLPVEEIKNDSRYRLLEPDSLSGGAGVAHDTQPEEDLEKQDYFYMSDGWVAVYEFYDLKEKWMMTFLLTGDAGGPIRYVENIKCPIVQIPNYRIPNCPYNVGELENIRSLQEELNKTRSQMITHRRRNVMKWMYRKDQVGQEALTAMKSGRINDMIPVSGTAPMEQLILPITPTPIGLDAYQMDAQIRADINEITGVNEYLRGVPQDIRRTATEASIIEGATNVRTRHKLLQIETAARQIGQLLLNIMADVIPQTDFEEMRLFITGREAERLNMVSGQSSFNTDAILTPTPEIFTGKYVVFVERGSAELRNQQAQAVKFRDMAQLVTSAYPVLQQAFVTINLRKIYELWFEAEGIQDVAALFELDENQMMMQMQQQMMGAAGAGGDVVGGAATPPGEPRQQTTQPPTQQISPENSGMVSAPPY